MSHFFSSVFVVFSLLLFTGCAATAQGAGKGHTSFNGTVRHQALEGGFYGIVTTSGEKLLPLNLPDGMRVDGLRVRGRYVPADTQIGIQMWGTRVRLLNIQPLRDD